jgi:hypothetical protein
MTFKILNGQTMNQKIKYHSGYQIHIADLRKGRERSYVAFLCLGKSETNIFHFIREPQELEPFRKSAVNAFQAAAC